ncbi:MAG: hypothetical protein KA116_12700 [Proteobacteria bacterium]|nr:hypothetical protein [Pseudomonadota bacterium]
MNCMGMFGGIKKIFLKVKSTLSFVTLVLIIVLQIHEVRAQAWGLNYGGSPTTSGSSNPLTPTNNSPVGFAQPTSTPTSQNITYADDFDPAAGSTEIPASAPSTTPTNVTYADDFDPAAGSTEIPSSAASNATTPAASETSTTTPTETAGATPTETAGAGVDAPEAAKEEVNSTGSSCFSTACTWLAQQVNRAIDYTRNSLGLSRGGTAQAAAGVKAGSGGTDATQVTNGAVAGQAGASASEAAAAKAAQEIEKAKTEAKNKATAENNAKYASQPQLAAQANQRDIAAIDKMASTGQNQVRASANTAGSVKRGLSTVQGLGLAVVAGGVVAAGMGAFSGGDDSSSSGSSGSSGSSSSTCSHGEGTKDNCTSCDDGYELSDKKCVKVEAE